MYLHFYNVKKTCCATYSDIELTDEVKQYILDNRIYKPKKSFTVHPNVKRVMDKMEIEIAFLKGKYNENFYQKILEQYLNGSHKTLKCGISDITTDEIHAEIKIWEDYKCALGQILTYDHEDPKQKLQVYFFGKYTDNKKESVIDLYKKHNIEVYMFQHIDLLKFYANHLDF
jgi:hypothetical protein